MIKWQQQQTIQKKKEKKNVYYAFLNKIWISFFK